MLGVVADDGTIRFRSCLGAKAVPLTGTWLRSGGRSENRATNRIGTAQEGQGFAALEEGKAVEALKAGLFLRLEPDGSPALPPQGVDCTYRRKWRSTRWENMSDTRLGDRARARCRKRGRKPCGSGRRVPAILSADVEGKSGQRA